MKHSQNGRKFLSIAVPTYQDWDGVTMTLTSLMLYHKDNLNDIEVVVFDNTEGSEQLNDLISSLSKVLDIKLFTNSTIRGTAPSKNHVISKCSGEFVLAMDSHIMLPFKTIDNLIKFFKLNPYTDDLYQGPYISNTGNTYIGNCFKPVWSRCMFGQWDFQPYNDEQQIEILMQGMGLFAFRRESWLGFHPLSKGFGGEEYYIHEKYRQAGRKCWSLQWLEWWHRAGHVNGVQYKLDVKDIIWNYLLSHHTLNTPNYNDIFNHFVPAYVSKKRFTNVEASVLEALKGV